MAILCTLTSAPSPLPRLSLPEFLRALAPVLLHRGVRSGSVQSKVRENSRKPKSEMIHLLLRYVHTLLAVCKVRSARLCLRCLLLEGDHTASTDAWLPSPSPWPCPSGCHPAGRCLAGAALHSCRPSLWSGSANVIRAVSTKEPLRKLRSSHTGCEDTKDPFGWKCLCKVQK